MKKLLIFIIVLFSGCYDVQRPEWICTCEQREKMADWISTNTKASNNMSDEEMEDVIAQLRYTAVKVHCSQRLMWQDSHDGWVNWEKEKLDSCETYH